MKEVELTKGYKALVDDEDFDRVNQFKWSACVQNRKGGTIVVYALRHSRTEPKTTKLHRFILGVTDINVDVDHCNHNTLDCQKKNLRLCTHGQNVANRMKYKIRSSKFKGVHWDKDSSKWRAQIQVRGVGKSLGRYVEEIEAAKAYNIAALEVFKEFAYLNEV